MDFAALANFRCHILLWAIKGGFLVQIQAWIFSALVRTHYIVSTWGTWRDLPLLCPTTFLCQSWFMCVVSSSLAKTYVQVMLLETWVQILFTFTWIMGHFQCNCTLSTSYSWSRVLVLHCTSTVHVTAFTLPICTCKPCSVSGINCQCEILFMLLFITIIYYYYESYHYAQETLGNTEKSQRWMEILTLYMNSGTDQSSSLQFITENGPIRLHRNWAVMLSKIFSVKRTNLKHWEPWPGSFICNAEALYISTYYCVKVNTANHMTWLPELNSLNVGKNDHFKCKNDIMEKEFNYQF